MRLARHRQFRKNYKTRILPNSNLAKGFEKRLNIFLADPKNPILRDHKLIGSMKNFRAFSITGDIRVIYRIEGEIIRLYDIGTHNQVY